MASRSDAEPNSCRDLRIGQTDHWKAAAQALLDLQWSSVFQSFLLRAEDERDKLDSELMKQKEKVGMVEAQVTRAQKDRENLQSEMEILLDRINKLSELLDKARVSLSCSHSRLLNSLLLLDSCFW